MLVIVAIDGSEAADIGVELVATTSWPPGTAIRVIESIDPWLLSAVGPLGAYASVATSEELDNAATENLARAAKRLAGAGLPVEVDLLRGRAASAIVDAAARLKADLIVLGSRGHGTIEKMLLGSVSAEVVDHSTAPVLVARGNRLGSVVLAWDGSECAARAANLLHLPIFATSSIRVVGVAHPEVPWWLGFAATGASSVLSTYADAAAASRRELDESLRAKSAELAQAGRRVEPELRVGDAAEELVATARQTAADLIVMGTHGRTGLSRLVLGSVARNVVQHAPCSVLVAR